MMLEGALVTAREARRLDEDLPLLQSAMQAAGARAVVPRSFSVATEPPSGVAH
jgi:hypothetical protein